MDEYSKWNETYKLGMENSEGRTEAYNVWCEYCTGYTLKLYTAVAKLAAVVTDATVK